MLSQPWRPRRCRARLALAGLASLMSLAALTALPPGAARAAVADGIQDKQQWVLNMLDVEGAWPVTRGAGVTVAVIDSGVNPNVSDLSGSVITAPTTPASTPARPAGTGACTAPGWRH